MQRVGVRAVPGVRLTRAPPGPASGGLGRRPGAAVVVAAGRADAPGRAGAPRWGRSQLGTRPAAAREGEGGRRFRPLARTGLATGAPGRAGCGAAHTHRCRFVTPRPSFRRTRRLSWRATGDAPRPSRRAGPASDADRVPLPSLAPFLPLPSVFPSVPGAFRGRCLSARGGTPRRRCCRPRGRPERGRWGRAPGSVAAVGAGVGRRARVGLAGPARLTTPRRRARPPPAPPRARPAPRSRRGTAPPPAAG